MTRKASPYYEAIYVTLECQRYVPRELSLRLVEGLFRFWQMLDGREADTPEARSEAFAEVCAALDDGRKLAPVVVLNTRRRLRKGSST
jgi:hypothetical protein